MTEDRRPRIADREKLPFRMIQRTAMEKYRAETFWTKEPETLAWIDSFNPHGVFYDVGANIGVYSLYAASRYPGMMIWAFEPAPANFWRLCWNISSNFFRNVLAYQCAIGDRTGSCALLIPDKEVGSSGTQARAGEGSYMNTIDLMALYLPRPDHIKIDIDGQEEAVIRGAAQTLPTVSSMLVEVSRATRNPIVHAMTNAGFTTDNPFNAMIPHSRERRQAKGIDAENIVFTRG